MKENNEGFNKKNRIKNKKNWQREIETMKTKIE
jgi:hypothetical protein